MGDNGKKHWVGFDLGGTKMLCALFDHKFNVVASLRKKTKADEGAPDGVERMIDMIERVLEEGHLDRDNLGGIGFGCPGPLDLDNGIVIEAPNLGWKNVELKSILQKKFKLSVAVANDVDAGTYGEYCFGAAQKARCVVGVFPGTGIGGGCVYEGKILRGRKSSCMEIGHIQIMPDGPRNGADKLGTLEGLASRLTISSLAAAAAFRGQAPHLMKTCGTDLANIRSGQLAEAIAQGDRAVELIVRDAARHIGIGVATLVCLFAPDVVLLGGGLVEAMPDLFVAEVTESARDRVLPSMADSFKVVCAVLGDDAGVMGAAGWAERCLR